MVLKNKVYDILKWVAMWLLPGMATLWLTLGKVWSFPYTTEIGATISAIDVFLAFILGLSNKNYQGDGTLNIDTSDPEKDTYNLELNDDVEELANKKTIMFKVVAKESEN